MITTKGKRKSLFIQYPFRSAPWLSVFVWLFLGLQTSFAAPPTQDTPAWDTDEGSSVCGQGYLSYPELRHSMHLPSYSVDVIAPRGRLPIAALYGSITSQLRILALPKIGYLALNGRKIVRVPQAMATRRDRLDYISAANTRKMVPIEVGISSHTRATLLLHVNPKTANRRDITFFLGKKRASAQRPIFPYENRALSDDIYQDFVNQNQYGRGRDVLGYWRKLKTIKGPYVGNCVSYFASTFLSQTALAARSRLPVSGAEATRNFDIAQQCLERTLTIGGKPSSPKRITRKKRNVRIKGKQKAKGLSKMPGYRALIQAIHGYLWLRSASSRWNRLRASQRRGGRNVVWNKNLDVLLKSVLLRYDQTKGKAYGTSNRGLGEGFVRAFIEAKYPREQGSRERQKYIREVWSQWSQFGDLSSNSSHYTGAALNFLADWFLYSKQRTAKQDKLLRAFVSRIKKTYFPSGFIPETGDGLGPFPIADAAWVVALEKSAFILKDRELKWIAHRVFMRLIEPQRAYEAWGSNISEIVLQIHELIGFLHNHRAVHLIPEQRPTLKTEITYTNNLRAGTKQQDHALLFRSDKIPNKMILRGGPSARDTTMMVELRPNISGHGHCNRGGIACLVSDDTILMQTAAYLFREQKYHANVQTHQSTQSKKVLDGRWHHIAATLHNVGSRGLLRLYVDGQEVERRTIHNGRFRGPFKGMIVGGDGDKYGLFQGSLKNVFVRQRAFQPKEIEALYKRGPNAIPRPETDHLMLFTGRSFTNEVHLQKKARLILHGRPKKADALSMSFHHGTVQFDAKPNQLKGTGTLTASLWMRSKHWGPKEKIPASMGLVVGFPNLRIGLSRGIPYAVAVNFYGTQGLASASPACSARGSLGVSQERASDWQLSQYRGSFGRFSMSDVKKSSIQAKKIFLMVNRAFIVQADELSSPLPMPEHTGVSFPGVGLVDHFGKHWATLQQDVIPVPYITSDVNLMLLPNRHTRLTVFAPFGQLEVRDNQNKTFLNKFIRNNSKVSIFQKIQKQTRWKSLFHILIPHSPSVSNVSKIKDFKIFSIPKDAGRMGGIYKNRLIFGVNVTGRAGAIGPVHTDAEAFVVEGNRVWATGVSVFRLNGRSLLRSARKQNQFTR
ncbi:MAG: hypothetical protein H6728_04725 [Myxococcales bacterium]|nr:hypothetical protein [Myxococcales bacterium]MCB9642356.1 hypothetical protein [Myxococcales bacterium]